MINGLDNKINMTTQDLIHSIESIFPNSWVNLYRRKKRDSIAYFAYLRKKRNEKRIAGKRNVYNVFFLLESSSLWKYSYLYELIDKSPYFHPVIIITPNILKSHEDMIADFNRCYYEMLSQGYNVIKGYIPESDMFIDVRTLDPHVIFFTNAWEEYNNHIFRIEKFSNILTCYMNYGWATTPHMFSFVTNVSTKVWRYLLECEDYKKVLSQWINSKNALVTGSPMYDAFIGHKETGKDWKVQNKTIKRIIYAPHHSIPGITDNNILALSTFLIHSETMLEIVELYKGKVQFVFKPHPLLKYRLYLHPLWGRQKTDEYYKKWENGENTNYINGEYIDLFKSSDALIHDCSSFTVEYLFTKKPALFLANFGHEGQANEVAMRAYNAHYKAKTKQEICAFIDDVVLGGKDTMKESRESFYNNVLLPPNGRTASENILAELTKALKINI